jgi:hypothetical protein
MRQSVRVSVYVAAVGVVTMAASLAAAGDLDRAVCAARAERRPDVVLAARGRVDLGFMAEPEHFASRSEASTYMISLVAGDGPRSLVAHDRLVLPGRPSDWVAAPRGADLVLCSRQVPATVVIARQFCTASVSVGDVANGEIEEITFLGGVTWLADDLFAEAGGEVPAEIIDDLRHDLAMASPRGHARDPDRPQAVVYAPQVARAVAAWTVTPMSGVVDRDAGAGAACLVRHADLRRGIVPARRVAR